MRDKRQQLRQRPLEIVRDRLPHGFLAEWYYLLRSTPDMSRLMALTLYRRSGATCAASGGRKSLLSRDRTGPLVILIGGVSSQPRLAPRRSARRSRPPLGALATAQRGCPVPRGIMRRARWLGLRCPSMVPSSLVTCTHRAQVATRNMGRDPGGSPDRPFRRPGNSHRSAWTGCVLSRRGRKMA